MDWRATIPVHLELDGDGPRLLELDVKGLEVPACVDDGTLRALALRHPRRLRWRSAPPRGEERRVDAGVALLLHTSRCGSTLAAHLLSVPAGARTLVEPEALNRILLAPLAAADRQRWIAWFFEGLVGGGAPPLLVKLSSWNALFFADLRAALPSAPVAAICRDPLEVLVSLTERPPAWLSNEGLAAELLAVCPPSPSSGASGASGASGSSGASGASGRGCVSALERAAALVSAIFSAILSATASEGGRLPVIDYEQLPEASWTLLTMHLLDLRLDSATVAEMRTLAKSDAKRPSRPFAPDRARKRASASAALRARAGAIDGLYRRVRARPEGG